MAQVTLREYLQETEDAISAERVDDALTHCQTILAQFPESLEAQRLIGEVYLALERLSDAQQNFDWVLTNDPENVVAYCDRALISEHMSDYDTALDCYQQAYELSRGNSHIRQEFNQLSAKAGQQGFMLSRAGLARLYMRGDLLTQAMQEWEVVLAVSPERLDARTGLLETYWREGLYDRVEQLATQILQDVPGCLKALLLLAYVTAAKNMQKAQELLQRAEVLDPDSTMAQELFSDALASQPTEPFLQLLRKPPALVETALSSSSAAAYAPPRQEEAFAQYATHASTDTGTGWNGAGWTSGPNWDSDTLVDAQEVQPKRNAPAAWDTHAAPRDDVWSALERQSEVPQPVAEVQNVNPWSMYGQSMQDDRQPQNTWQQELQNATPNEQKQSESTAWDSAAFDRYKDKEPSFGGLDTWETLKGNDSADTAGVWSSSSREEVAPAPPAWLNMLTQSERKQASGPLPAGTVQPPSTPVQPLPAPEQPPSTPVQPPTTPVQPPAQPAASVQPVSIEEPAQKEASAVPESLDDEPFSFGPEWLKSLGAASIDTVFPIESSPVAAVPPAPEPVASEPLPEAPRQEVQEPREPQAAQTSESTEDQRLLRTLEKLESDLRSQGFVPLQPNSLSSLTQTPEPATGGAILEHGAEAQEASQGPREAYRGEAALSSALAELGNYIHQSSSLLNASPAQDVAAAEPAQPAPEPAMPPVPAEGPSWLAALGRDAAFSPPTEEPSWIASLNSVPSPSASTDQVTQDETMANLFSSSEQPFWAGLDVPREQPIQEQPLQESVPAEITEPAAPAWSRNDALQGSSEEQPAQEVADGDAAASPIWPASTESNEAVQEAPVAQFPAPFVSATTPSGQLPPVPATPVQMNGGQETRQSPAVRSEALFDSELEATMKRPAVRLQPMQQRSASQKDAVSGGKTRGTERASGSKVADGNVSYQERLQKGYQHQLFGDYDEAMQEYRVVIRNAPELLTDVVSNVRALLKLAPKYATGYRVLGDAYMRQGEYLQAMEAYNKALTMAKRAKS
jgi:tetratricopeptide (TPR) repeat protein